MSKGFRRNAPRTLRFFVRTCVSSRQPLVPFRGMRPGLSCGSSTPRFRSFSRTHRSIRSPFFGSTSDGTIHGPTSPPLHPSSLPSRGCRTPEARPRHHHPRRPCHVHSRFVKKNPPRLPFLSRFSLFFYGRGWWGGDPKGVLSTPRIRDERPLKDRRSTRSLSGLPSPRWTAGVHLVRRAIRTLRFGGGGGGCNCCFEGCGLADVAAGRLNVATSASAWP